MKGFSISSKVFSAILFLFFLLPYILFFKFFTFDIQLNSSELAWALKNTFIQATAAAAVSTALGLFFAFGLLQLKPSLQALFSKLLLVPQVLPSLFSILIAFAIVNPFPIGFLGVIFIFILINIGFATFLLFTAIKQKMQGFALTGEIYGIGQLQFLRKVFFPIIRTDLKFTFILIFLFCVSSLSIPLVAGGGKGTNLEVLIFEKIFIEQAWNTAWFLMIIQTLIVFGLSYLFLKNRSAEIRPFVPHRYLKSKVGLIAVLAYIAIYFISYFCNVYQSWPAFDFLSEYAHELYLSLLSSLQMLVLVLLVAYIILIAWVSDYIQQLKHNKAIHLISGSTVLIGFAFYITFPQTRQFDMVKIPLAFTILFYPTIFKVLLEKPLDQIKNQIIVAKVFGLSRLTIINSIIFKQLKRPLYLAVSMITIWTLSDFAILRSLGTQVPSLGLMTQNFLLSYRLNVAYLISFIILIVWAIITIGTYLVMEGFSGNHKTH